MESRKNSRNQRNSCDYQETYQTGNYGDFPDRKYSEEDLNPIEEALAFKRLLTEFNLKQDEVAERVSKSRTAVTNAMRLLKLNEKVQQMVIDEMLTTGHARALLGIEDQEQQYIIAQKIFDEKLSVRDTEKLVKSLQNEKRRKRRKRED